MSKVKAERIPLDGVGCLYLLIDPPEVLTRHHCAFVGEEQFSQFDNIVRLIAPPTIRCVHVMSPAAGGEVRGYFLIDVALHRRSPNYPGDWPEVDAAAAKALGAAVFGVVTRRDQLGLFSEAAS